MPTSLDDRHAAAESAVRSLRARTESREKAARALAASNRCVEGAANDLAGLIGVIVLLLGASVALGLAHQVYRTTELDRVVAAGTRSADSARRDVRQLDMAAAARANVFARFMRSYIPLNRVPTRIESGDCETAEALMREARSVSQRIRSTLERRNATGGTPRGGTLTGSLLEALRTTERTIEELADSSKARERHPDSLGAPNFPLRRRCEQLER